MFYNHWEVVSKIKNHEQIDHYIISIMVPEILKEKKLHDSYFKTIDYLTEKKHYASALLISQKLYEIKKTNRIIYLISQLYHLMGDNQTAYYIWYKKLDDKKTNFKHLNLKVTLLIELGYKQKAIHIIKTIQSKTKKYYNLFYKLGLLYYETGKFTESFNSYMAYYSYVQSVWPEILLKFSSINYINCSKLIDNINIHLLNDFEELYAISIYYLNKSNFHQAHYFANVAFEKEKNNWHSILLLLKIYYKLNMENSFKEAFLQMLILIPANQGEIVDILEGVYYYNCSNDVLFSYLFNLYLHHHDKVISFKSIQWLIKFAIQKNKSKIALDYLNKYQDHSFDKDLLSHLYADLYADLNFDKKIVIDHYLIALNNKVNDPLILYRLVNYCMNVNEFPFAIELIQKYELSIYWHPSFNYIKNDYDIILHE